MKHIEIDELLGLVDNELSLEVRKELEIHLSQCDECRDAYHALKGFEILQVGSEVVSDNFTENVIAKWQTQQSGFNSINPTNNRLYIMLIGVFTAFALVVFAGLGRLSTATTIKGVSIDKYVDLSFMAKISQWVASISISSNILMLVAGMLILFIIDLYILRPYFNKRTKYKSDFYSF